jgi:hypothetical protein
MKAISLWQPWASAIALGHKRVETRHWSTPYRGPLAIHAAKRFGPAERHFASTEVALGRLPNRIPLGAIVATCRLVDVRPTDELKLTVSAIERLYGNYEPGRFGWLLEDIQPLAEPIAWTGKQGFFSVPDELFTDRSPHA